jgi:8-oxo-dGTP diphosphatase
LRATSSVRVLVCRDGRFLLVRQGGHWLPPGGTPEPGEAPEDTARREVREETGVEVELLGALGRMRSPRGRPTLLLAARIASGQPQAAGLAGEGITEIAWLAPDDPALDSYTRALLAAWRTNRGGRTRCGRRW